MTDSRRTLDGSHRSTKANNMAQGYEGKESQFKKHKAADQGYEQNGMQHSDPKFGPLINDASGYYHQQQQMVRTTVHEAKPQFEATPDAGTNYSSQPAKGKKGKKKKKKNIAAANTEQVLPEILPQEFHN
mmetsp:Transcript_21052/g.32585  ORF Transcript_21052/g.32585 Transcript_21052/m.32585 type:complete len:130 (-) Transcript_21052:3450-3839(-)